MGPEFWRVFPPLGLIALISGMAFFYVRAIVDKAITQLKEALSIEIKNLDKQLSEKIQNLERSDIKSESIKDHVSEISTRLKESTEYAHTVRHDLANRYMAHELLISQHTLEIQAMNLRLNKVEQLPDLLEAKLNLILAKVSEKN